MNRSNKFTTFLLSFGLISLLAAGNLAAQPGRGGNQPPALPDAEEIEQMVDELSTTLSLTEVQEAAVSALYTAHFEEARELMESNKGGRTAMESLREELEEQVGDVLNDEQKAEYEKLMEDQRPSSGQRGRRRN